MSILIRRVTETFSAPDPATLRTWIAEGRIIPTDLIHDSTSNRWLPPAQHPATAGVNPPPHVKPNPMGTPFQLGCLGGVLLVAGPVIGGMLNSSLIAFGILGLGAILIVASLIAGVLKRSA